MIGSRTARLAVAALTLVVGARVAGAEVIDFDPGALIIPLQSNYQSACGTVSAYGLVWRILQSNQTGHYNANHPVTVYWAIGTKDSVNRCVPSNLHDANTPSTSPNTSNTSWNDGCDVIIPDNSVTTTTSSPQPVTMAPLSTALPANNLYPKTAITNFDTRNRYSEGDHGYPYATPSYKSYTMNETKHFNRVRYLGGPFIIAAADVPNVIGFLQNGDSYVTASELSKFITSDTSCDDDYAPSTDNHFVRAHMALQGFSASVARKMNSTPPKIALVNIGSGVSTGILDAYLKNAGLDEVPGCANSHTCYGGCPETSGSSCTANGSTNNPLVKHSGLIYDNLDGNLDLHSTATDHFGLINKRDAKNKLIYRVLWAPHWTISAKNGSGSYAYTQIAEDGSNQPEDVNLRNNIGRFTDNPSTGLMNECASIGSYEGGSNTSPNDPGTNQAKLMSTNGWTINKLDSDFWSGRDCRDPNYTETGDSYGGCMLYPAPSDPFSQIGDFTFFMVSGVVQDFVPQTGSAYVPGEQRLAVSYPNYSPSGDGTIADALAKAPSGNKNRTAFTYGQKNNDSQKATILYLGGHQYNSTSVPGNRVVLNTLLNLGFDPVSNERSLTQPIGYVDPNGSDSDGTRVMAIGSTYYAVTGYPASTAVRSFTAGSQSQWVFPYYPGDLRAHSLVGGTTLASGESSLAASTLWNSGAIDVLPAPNKRNIFTYFGGQVKTTSSLPSYDNSGNAGTGGAPTYGEAQTGWTPSGLDFHGVSTLPTMVLGGTASGCVDVMSETLYTDGGWNFSPAQSDGICDVEEAAQFTQPTKLNVTTVDYVTTRVGLLLDLTNIEQMMQKVLGWCVSTSGGVDGIGSINFTPTGVGTQSCNSDTDDNHGKLGGLVHSVPAIVPASANLPNDTRPTVAYAGGWDGMLHAFYVSGGSGYSAPPVALHYPGKNASSVFQSAPNLSQIAAGQEMWAYLPSSQIPWLRSNNARVDSSPVFGEFHTDLVGSGQLEWHTIVAASVGSTTGREIFALDVTNPLKPVLLWDMAGSLYQQSNFPYFSPTSLANKTTSGTDDKAPRWDEKLASFINPVNYSTDPGVTRSGVFDYSDLGASVGMSVGQINGGPGILVVTSNTYADGVPYGVEVYGINIANGQKLWQWHHAYATLTQNSAPPFATLAGVNHYVDTVWVGDNEGKLWELDAATGRNKNVITTGTGERGSCSAAAPCGVPAFDDGAVNDSTSSSYFPKPVTTNLAVGTIDPAATGALSTVAGKTFLMFGTGGYDWVPATKAGTLHMVILDQGMRVAAGNPKVGGGTWTAAAAASYQQGASGQVSGVLQEAPGFPISMANGEHFYASITVSGTDAFFTTANGPIGNDVMAIATNVAGKTYQMKMTTAASGSMYSQFAGTQANFGGVTVVHNAHGGTSTDYVVGQEVSKISNTVINNASTAGDASPQAGLNPNGGTTSASAAVMNWIRRLWSAP